jgi:GH25 family lysozyme M1 (1,4-beta-N-acetylmuramidase)
MTEGTTTSMRRALAAVAGALAVIASWSVAPPARAEGMSGRPPSGAATTSAPLVAQPLDTLAGIDVSHWQDAIDWTSVAASGVQFVIAKATEGRTWDDPMYVTYKAGAAAEGIPFTAYHFARPDDTAGDAVKEADHFVDVAQLGPGNLIPALDIERTGGLTQAQLTQWILDWLNEVTLRLGVRPMVYTSPNGWVNRTGDTTAIADAGYTVLWIANWNVASPTVPANDWEGNGWTFWQYTDCASVPGIIGCVDADWHAGTTLDDVTIAGPDTTPPTATVTPPPDLGSPALVSFSEPVHEVTSDNAVLWQPDAGAPVPSTLACRSGKGVLVDCATGNVWRLTLQPQEPLVAGQSYAVLLDPAGAVPQIVDRAGNPLATVEQDFVGPLDVEQDSPGVGYAWRSMKNRHAYGGSYQTEHLAGATYTMTFRGRSVTWYTATGPAQGKAEVFIDGRSRGMFDQYAPVAGYKVARPFTKLQPGWHTIVIRVLGTHAKAASDTQVAVDAFGFGGDVVRSPSGTMAWRTVDISNASGGSVAITDTARASVSFSFRGTGVDWMTVRGPSQGRAAIYVDGAFVRTVDNYADSPTPNVARAITGLADGVHALQIVGLGESRPKASDALVTIDAFVVTP